MLDYYPTIFPWNYVEETEFVEIPSDLQHTIETRMNYNRIKLNV
jgi:hypothetical protein